MDTFRDIVKRVLQYATCNAKKNGYAIDFCNGLDLEYPIGYSSWRLTVKHDVQGEIFNEKVLAANANRVYLRHEFCKYVPTSRKDGDEWVPGFRIRSFKNVVDDNSIDDLAFKAFLESLLENDAFVLFKHHMTKEQEASYCAGLKNLGYLAWKNERQFAQKQITYPMYRAQNTTITKQIEELRSKYITPDTFIRMIPKKCSSIEEIAVKIDLET